MSTKSSDKSAPRLQAEAESESRALLEQKVQDVIVELQRHSQGVLAREARRKIELTLRRLADTTDDDHPLNIHPHRVDASTKAALLEAQDALSVAIAAVRQRRTDLQVVDARAYADLTAAIADAQKLANSLQSRVVERTRVGRKRNEASDLAVLEMANLWRLATGKLPPATIVDGRDATDFAHWTTATFLKFGLEHPATQRRSGGSPIRDALNRLRKAKVWEED